MAETKMKLGSLFDGIAGFPLVASWYGIEPVWASEIEKPCIRITKKHFPNMKHLGDITKIHGDQIEPVDIITGGSPCFPAGTMVLTNQGYIPIENIQVNDVVLTHKGRWRKVTAVGSREAETFLLKGNVTIETTSNHPIYSADIKRSYARLENGRRTNRKILVANGQWTNAENMKGRQWATPVRTELLPIPFTVKTESNQKPMPKLNNDFWYFVGRWIGDGWVRNGFRKEKPNGNGYGTIYICDSHDKEDELTNMVSKISENYSIERCRTGVKVRFTSQLLCEWLVNNFGKGAMNKTIPGWVLSLSYEHRTALFSGIIDSDGYRKSDTSMKVTSISKQLILGVRMLAESLGYTTSVSYYKRPVKCIIEGRIVNQHDTYSVAICNNKNRRTGIEHGGHKWYKCRDVIKTGETKTVYNISVEEDESYIADSIVVHNCQDLSVAGKQSGIRLKCDNCGTLVEFSDSTQNCPNCGAKLDFTRSGLFMEQIRIIREMREKTNECYPKIVIWENVLGALSSNNGNDFFCVLQEFCKLMAERIPTFRPESWSNAGEILGESCSIAWRLFDAQYWGVPQRRRRIFLVADFGGQRAGEILFKSESLHRHLTPSRAPWKRFTSKAESGIGESSRNTERYGVDTYNATITDCVSSTLGMNCGTSTGRNGVLEEYDLKPICVATQQANAEIMTDVCPTLTAANGTSGNKPYVVLPESDEEKPIAFEPGASSRLGGHAWEDVTGTLTSQMGDNQMSVVTKEKPVVYGFCSMSSNSMNSDNPDSGIYEADVSKTLDTNGLNPTCNQGGNAVVEEPTTEEQTIEGPVYCIQGNCIDRADTAGCNGKGWREDVSYTLTAMDRPAVAYETHDNQGTEAEMVNANPASKAYGVWQNGNAEVGIMEEKTCTLTTGGGKPGQGYPCVLLEDQSKTDDTYVAAFAYQQGGSMPTLPYGEKISPPLLSSQKTAVLIDNHPADSRVEIAKDDVCQTLSARMGTGGGNVPLVMETDESIAYGQSGYGDYVENRVSTLKCTGGDLGGGSESLILKQAKAEDIYVVTDASHTQVCVNQSPTLTSRDYKDPHFISKPKSIVRRLTPLECERLQGYPDGWTASESDSARYKALGNSVALPCVDYIMSGIADVLDEK